MATVSDSKKVMGVYQRKNGTWFYRIKIKPILGHGIYGSSDTIYLQKSGFPTKDAAIKARTQAIREVRFKTGDAGYTKAEILEETIYSPRTFATAFDFFVNRYIESENSRKKYRSLYNQNLTMWANQDVRTLTDADIDLLLLSLSLQGKKPSYISAVRKMLKLFFDTENYVDAAVGADMVQGITTKPYKLRVLSLFSGIGAPERALENLGIDFEIVNYCEVEPNAIKAYCLLHGLDYEAELDPNNPNKKNLGDISKVNPFMLPDFDLMFFGSPCQNFSSEGNRKGLRDEDGNLTASGLIFYALNIAKIKKPKFLIAENVKNLIDGNKKDFAEILDSYRDMGYITYNKVLNSLDFGIPQNRERLFSVSIRNDVPMRFHFPKGQLRGKTNFEDYIESEIDEKLYVTAEQYETYTNAEEFPPHIIDLTKGDLRDAYIHCIKTKAGTRGNGSQNFFIDEKGMRCLSSEELMHFQGFNKEDGTLLVKSGIAYGSIGKLVGNSITVPVVQAIFQSLMEQLCKGMETDYKSTIPNRDGTKSDYILPFIAYTGNKAKLLPALFKYFPRDLPSLTFVDLFAGAGTVGINVDAKRVFLNEIDETLTEIYSTLQLLPPETVWEDVYKEIEHYELTPYDADAFYRMRKEYNLYTKEERAARHYYAKTLALLYHSFNGSTIRYDEEGNYNASAGISKDGQNTKISMRLAGLHFFPYAEKLFYSENIEISNKDFREFDFSKFPSEETFVYVDPPYFITKAAYNNTWKESDERDLYAFLDGLNERGIMWMLSNVIHNKGRTNQILSEWIAKNEGKYHVRHLERDYSSAIKPKGAGQVKDTDEIIVFNYQI